MKKTSMVCILLMVLILAGCKAPEDQVNETVEEEAVVEEEANLVSNLNCANGVITATITNTGEETIDLSKDIRVIIRGLVVANKIIECEKTSLKPGESTLCSKLNGVYPVVENNALVVRFGTEQVLMDVACK
jgi:archaellum component FlaG (FlaF/FlaG flagellin family)